MKLTELSKTISHALRHEPWVYELELDEQGWVDLDELLFALKETSPSWNEIDRSTIQKIIDSADKKRFEISHGKIRALYGHSFPQKLSFTPDTPPSTLYHGTTSEIAMSIRNQGLKPMGRHYVHLSPDLNIAKEVAKRKGKDIEILVINAEAAHKNGIKFYRGNKYVWLSDFIPPDFIEVIFSKH